MFTTEEIAKLIGGRLEGNPSLEIKTIKNIEKADKGSLSFIASKNI
ncbi:MAG: hypothetical protein R2771_03265 [Saprospiraceae bacterium]